MSPTFAAFSFSLGIALLLLAFAPEPLTGAFSRSPQQKRKILDKLRQGLRLAGIFDKAPAVVLLALGGVTVALGVVVSVLFGSPLYALSAIIIVPGAAYYMLMSRQRSFMERASGELGPFLNRIQTSAKAGKPVQAAYIEAVEESRELRRVLANSAAKITAGMRFREALVETIPLLPFRMWSVFVRQVEAHDESGGDISSALEETVTQTNEILMLHAEARADFATQAKQQKLIVAVAFGGVAFFAIAVDPEIMRTLWTTVPGFIGMAISFAIMSGGLWFSRKQLHDIEKKQAF